MSRQRLCVERFEAKLCLAAVSFDEHVIVASDTNGASSVYAADLDGDGDLDMLSASYRDGKVAWYENTDGKGRFGDQQVLTTEAVGRDSHLVSSSTVRAADIDGDGDLDVLSATAQYVNRNVELTIAWHQNLDGFGRFGPRQVIIKTEGLGASIDTADVDGDGDVDILSSSGWHENTDGNGNFRSLRGFPRFAISVHAADVDGDGDMDAVTGYTNFIAWYENTDGLGTPGPQQIITTSVLTAASVHAADFDGDGDLDVLSASIFHNLAWYENTDGRGSFGPARMIAGHGSSSLLGADIDGDGDADVLSTTSNYKNSRIAWYENTDGKGSFVTRQFASEEVLSLHAADLDGDSDLDLLTASRKDDKIAWYENTDGRGSFGGQNVVSRPGASSVFSAAAGDLDGDGDLDVLSAARYGDNGIAWYENTDGRGRFGTKTC